MWLAELLIGSKISVVMNCYLVGIVFFDAKRHGMDIGLRPLRWDDAPDVRNCQQLAPDDERLH